MASDIGTGLHVALVAADRTVWSGEASMVIARTVDGDVGVLRGHAPLLSLLTDAAVEISAPDGIVLSEILSSAKVIEALDMATKKADDTMAGRR